MGLLFGGYNKVLLHTLTPLTANLNRRRRYSLVKAIEKTSLYQPFYLYGYEKSQWLPPEELKKIQFKKLHDLLKHAYENVPYYCKIFDNLKLKPDDIKMLEDIQKLPILTKEIIRKNFSDMLAKNIAKSEIILERTGGSSGTPLKFYTTHIAKTYIWASMFRSRIWQGVTRRDKRLQFNAAIPDRKYWYKNEYFLSVFDFSDEYFEKHMPFVQKFNPDHITGHTSSVYILAKFLQKNPKYNLQPKAIEVHAEVLLPRMKSLIEKVFKAEVFNHFGGKEITTFACECPEHNGFHISIENGILEVLKNNQPVLDEIGELTITDFSNYAMPFIRYKNEDSAILASEGCPCGRSLPLMKSLLGRTLDLIQTPEGNYLPTPFFTVVFRLDGIRQYQVIQESLRKLTINIVKDVDFTNGTFNKLKENMRKFVGEKMALNFNFLDFIPLTSAGKQKIIISKIGKAY